MSRPSVNSQDRILLQKCSNEFVWSHHPSGVWHYYLALFSVLFMRTKICTSGHFCRLTMQCNNIICILKQSLYSCALYSQDQTCQLRAITKDTWSHNITIYDNSSCNLHATMEVSHLKRLNGS